MALQPAHAHRPAEQGRRLVGAPGDRGALCRNRCLLRQLRCSPDSHIFCGAVNVHGWLPCAGRDLELERARKPLGRKTRRARVGPCRTSLIGSVDGSAAVALMNQLRVTQGTTRRSSAPSVHGQTCSAPSVHGQTRCRCTREGGVLGRAASCGWHPTSASGAPTAVHSGGMRRLRPFATIGAPPLGDCQVAP